VPTIKYYLRVGLLAAGRTTAHNQATYDDSHLRRLRLIRVFVDIGGLTVMATREVLTAIDNSRLSGEHLLGVIDSARGITRRRALDGDVRNATLRNVSAIVANYGWRVQPDSPALQRLTDVCVAARLLEMRELCGVLDAYAKAASHAAECDVAVTRAMAERMGSAPNVLMEAVMAAVVLGNALLTTLHSMAREDALARLFAEWEPGNPDY
jgi:DNA-binding transcriptional MerR regulator